MPKISVQTSSVHVYSPTKIRIAKTCHGLLRGAMTLAARALFKDVDGRYYSAVLPEALFTPWQADNEFLTAFERIAPYTTVDIYRCYELWQLVGQLARNSSGHVIEVGVWRGGTGCLLATRAQALNKNVRTFLCDTFRGVVKAGEHDNVYHGGEHADTSKQLVETLASDLGLHNVTVLDGIFPEETGHQIGDDVKFALCHIDVDVYQSAKDTVDWIWPRLQSGGVIVFDDYGFPNARGVTRYVDELSNRDGLVMIYNLNGHALIIKT